MEHLEYEFGPLPAAVAEPPVPVATPPTRSIRNRAVRALLEELVTYPKPGLVSLVDNGSHDDMDATTFVRSTLALRRYFENAARAGQAPCSFDTLRQLGVEAEARMLKATRGVNTHRGAVFNLGLLAAAAGRSLSMPPSWHPSHGFDGGTLGRIVASQWGVGIAAHRRDAASHGSRIGARYGAGGAQAEAAAGFPSVYRVALPAYRGVIAGGGSANQARVQAFFALVAQLQDTNLLHRGGPQGLAFAQAQAQAFIERGGVACSDWCDEAADIHRRFVERRLSPGGSADLLAACVFVHAFEG
jgi:triphosphoribosyl-dephospho-CoA synthase